MRQLRRNSTGRRTRTNLLRMEALEERRLLAVNVFHVDDFTDDDPGDGSVGHTLRWAITQANATSNDPLGPDQIVFDLPSATVQTIPVGSALPDIADAVVIDGYTNSYAAPNTNEIDDGSNAAILVQLDGSGAGAGVDGLVLAAGSGGSTIQGLAIGKFTGYGINIVTNENAISGNFIGTDATGTSPGWGDIGNWGNAAGGVYVHDGAFANSIGGLTEGRNLISGNGGQGVWVKGTSTLQSADSDTVAVTNTIIATTYWEDEESNQKALFTFTDTAGLAPGAKIRIFDHTTGSYNNIPATVQTVSGSLVATDLPYAGTGTGTWKLDEPFYTHNDPDWEIDGTDAVFTVVITHLQNTLTGVERTTQTSEVLAPIDSNADSELPLRERILRTAFNFISGNYIGTDKTGASACGNEENGVLVSDGAFLTIIGSYGSNFGPLDDSGELIYGEGNVVSGNGANGIDFRGVNSYTYLWNTIFGKAGTITEPESTLLFASGNLIGTNAAGDDALGNIENGIHIHDSARGAIIGFGALSPYSGEYTETELDALRTVISGNGGNGILESDRYTTNLIVGRANIGTNLAGAAAIANELSGILVQDGPSGTVIGCDNNLGQAEAQVLIAGNKLHGVWFLDCPPLPGHVEPSNNGVFGNLIGVNAAGTPIPNGRELDPDSGVGVLIENSANVRVGGGGNVASVFARNVISGNENDGIRITGSKSVDNRVYQNFIGFDPRNLPSIVDGSVTDYDARPNEGAGIRIDDGAHDNVLFNFVTRNEYLAEITGAAVIGLVNQNLIDTNLAAFDIFADEILDENDDPVLDYYSYDLYIDEPDEEGRLQFHKVNQTRGLTARALGNYIAANTDGGIIIDGANTSDNIVAGSVIGLSVEGNAAFVDDSPRYGNGDWGIAITGGADGNLIGSDLRSKWMENKLVAANIPTSPGIVDLNTLFEPHGYVPLTSGQSQDFQRNLVSQNELGGIKVAGAGGDDFNRIASNAVGLDSTAAAAGNGGDGILIDGAAKTFIGGFEGDGGNVVSANSGSGIHAQGSGIEHLYIASNLIGTDHTGNEDRGNSGAGVLIEDTTADGIVVGTFPIDVGDLAGITYGNLIAGNGQAGVHFNNVAADLDNGRMAVISGNVIGLSLDGAVLKNDDDGVLIENSIDTVIGFYGINTISGNEENGVHITGSSSSGTRVGKNLIGVDSTGTLDRGNGGDGILIDGGADGNQIGDTSGHGNAVAYNGGNGVAVIAAVHNAIFGNSIFGNTLLGIDLASGGNDSQPAPTLSNATRVSSTTITVDVQISGSVPPSGTVLEFFYDDGFGEGQTQITVTSVVNNGSYWTITLNDPNDILTAASIVATAIDSDGDTSEFSSAFTAP